MKRKPEVRKEHDQAGGLEQITTNECCNSGNRKEHFFKKS